MRTHETQSLYTGTHMLKYPDGIRSVPNSLQRSFACELWHTLTLPRFQAPWLSHAQPARTGDCGKSACGPAFFLQHCYPRSFQMAWLLVQAAKDVRRVRPRMCGVTQPLAPGSWTAVPEVCFRLRVPPSYTLSLQPLTPALRTHKATSPGQDTAVVFRVGAQSQ